jgi:hypothetical protein
MLLKNPLINLLTIFYLELIISYYNIIKLYHTESQESKQARDDHLII